jgi:hypothetical protein
MKHCPVVEALDEGEDIALGLGAGLVVPMMNEFGLQGMEEALHRGIVVAIGFAAHRWGDAGAGEGVAIGVRGILGGFKRSEWWINPVCGCCRWWPSSVPRTEGDIRGLAPAARMAARQQRSASIVAELFNLWEIRGLIGKSPFGCAG